MIDTLSTVKKWIAILLSIAWMNQKLIIEPIFGQSFSDLAVVVEDADGIIVLYDSIVNYAFPERTKKFDREINIGKVYQITYDDLVCDKAGRV